MRSAVLLSLLLLGACQTYAGPPPGAPRAELSLQAELRRDVSEGVDIVLFDNPDCLLTNAGGSLGLIDAWSDPLVVDVFTDKRVYLLVHRLSTDVRAGPGGLQTASVSCFDMVSFVPEQNDRYAVQVGRADGGCPIQVFDALVRRPASLQTHDPEPGCRRRWQDFKRAGSGTSSD